MNKPEELSIPEVIFKAEQSAEMMRLWLADGEQVVAISPRLWDDPATWGLMLVDMARHVAQAYQSKGLAPEESLRRIRMAMDAEWANPTGIP
ncbi:DUF5076 domain-containing protein [Acidovorax sp. NCPPB 2350]|nr:DUF5076 domain-containing protein [Acidovorax sp. NCPPB 2350]